MSSLATDVRGSMRKLILLFLLFEPPCTNRYHATLTCVSFISSDGEEFIFVVLRLHSKIVILGLYVSSVHRFQLNAQALRFTRCQQMNVVVTCACQRHWCNATTTIIIIIIIMMTMIYTTLPCLIPSSFLRVRHHGHSHRRFSPLIPVSGHSCTVYTQPAASPSSP